ncbi:unnamed protein product [Eruca vesicaria subsp. sativa]|uniref:Uncharacterized protein n=1 Tax=Eruca vesicaria subsp. sativa TaxID=29727 RepID=A0ABC8KS05_ERUVS|nr:unnamed protein product [Eruca vesicaria subsp. sativa]
MFIKSWAHICKLNEPLTGTLPEELTPVINRTVIDLHVADLESKMLELNEPRTLELPPVTKTGSGLVRLTLELTREHIDKLKERAESEVTRLLSTFVVASAYLWSCLVKARGGDADRPVAFMYAADFRNRLNRPVPDNYFGNCVFPIGCFGYEAKMLMGEDGFVNAVKILTDSVRDLGSRGIETVCELYVDGIKNLKPGTQIDSVSIRGGFWVGETG